MLFYIAIAAAFAAILIFSAAMSRRSRLASLMATPLPLQWRHIIARNLHLWEPMSPDLKDRLGSLVQLFLAGKRYEGCGGMTITDEVRVTIAANACLLLLGRTNRVFPRLTTILVYPDAYIARRETSLGTGVLNHEEIRSGEAWQGGPVVIAWNEFRAAPGRNVIIHEFAHVIDHEGLILPVGEFHEWADDLTDEFEALREAAEMDLETVLDGYGAASEAEFFAVATETFFERPNLLERKHPRLYGRLAQFYALDPAQW